MCYCNIHHCYCYRDSNPYASSNAPRFTSEQYDKVILALYKFGYGTGHIHPATRISKLQEVVASQANISYVDAWHAMKELQKQKLFEWDKLPFGYSPWEYEPRPRFTERGARLGRQLHNRSR